jgi:hypothetical protein
LLIVCGVVEEWLGLLAWCGPTLLGGLAYTGDVDHCVDSVHCGVEYAYPSEIFNDHKVQLGCVLWSCGFHLLAFLSGSCCPADEEAAGEKVVDDMSADEACGSGDKNVPSSCQFEIRHFI